MSVFILQVTHNLWKSFIFLLVISLKLHKLFLLLMYRWICSFADYSFEIIFHSNPRSYTASSGMVDRQYTAYILVLRTHTPPLLLATPPPPQPPERWDVWEWWSDNLTESLIHLGWWVLDESYSAKPAQRSSHTGPPGYIGWTRPAYEEWRLAGLYG